MSKRIEAVGTRPTPTPSTEPKPHPTRRVVIKGLTALAVLTSPFLAGGGLIYYSKNGLSIPTLDTFYSKSNSDKYSPKPDDNLIEAMMRDTYLNDIAHNAALLNSNLMGQISFSQDNLFFNEQLVDLSPQPKGTVKGPIGEPVDGVVELGPELHLTVKGSQSGQVFGEVTYPGSLVLKAVKMDESLEQHPNDKKTHFWVASNLQVVTATKELLENSFQDAALGKLYTKSKPAQTNEELVWNIITKANYSGVPYIDLARYMSHFYLLPNFQKAIESKRLAGSDLAEMEKFGQSAEYFLSKGMLYRTGDQLIWGWRNGKEFWKTWTNRAISDLKSGKIN